MKIGLVTLFPAEVDAFLRIGVVGRAIDRGLVRIDCRNPRDYTDDRHRSVDDRPFGGGPGMVMRPAPLVAAIEALRQRLPAAPTVYLSPRGVPLRQPMLARWAEIGSLVLLSGRYEGIDERVVDSVVDEEVSLGDFVLSGGEIAALAVIDGLARLVPGVLGHPQSAIRDSFAGDGLLECPHYTRPETFAGRTVPPVLLSGDHAAIARWRRQQALTITLERRPDLLQTATLSAAERDFINQHGPVNS